MTMEPLVRNAKQEARRHWPYYTAIAGVLIILLVLLTVFVTIPKPTSASHALAGDWSTFLGGNGRPSYNGAETAINPSTVGSLKQHWVLKTGVVGGKITTQPVVANGILYWGSWDGYEHASDATTGASIWTVPLGQSTDCRGEHLGVLSTATVTSASIEGVIKTVVFVGGGNSTLYALNASTGNILWQTHLGADANSFLYSSPAVYNGSVYIGVSGSADCSKSQGELVQVDASTGNVQNTFTVVPTGCTGGSVWTAPTINEATGMLYFSTSEKGSCSTGEKKVESLMQVRATDLSLVGYWVVPAADMILDGDFGATPTLFQATIGGVQHYMVGLPNKSGIFYAFDQSNVGAGPLWQVRLATAPGPSMASAGWDGTNLYVQSGPPTANSTTCPGILWSLNPNNGNAHWDTCLNFDARGGIMVVPGLIEVGLGQSMSIFDATNGTRLFNFTDSLNKSNFEGPGVIANGMLYHGNLDGRLYAFGP